MLLILSVIAQPSAGANPLFEGAKGQYVGKGIMSLYRPWKKSATVPYARYPGNWRVLPTLDDLVCAHRTIPFWTILRIRKGSRTVYCQILDRGPWGFCEKRRVPIPIAPFWGLMKLDFRMGDLGGRNDLRCPKRYRYRVIVKRWKRKRLRGWYRGLIDATPAVHKMIGSDGWTTVHVESLGRIGQPKRVLRQKRLSSRSNLSLAYVQIQ